MGKQNSAPIDIRLRDSVDSFWFSYVDLGQATT